MSAIATPVTSREALSPTTRATAVALRDLTKRFPVDRQWRELLRGRWQRKRVTAVDAVSCDVMDGEFFGLLGPNGAGKTTLFKMLSTLVLPDSGSATILGADVARDSDEVRRVLAPVTADERSLNWRLSAHENLQLFGVLKDVPAPELRQRVEEVLAIVHLEDVGEKRVGQFSSGMKQRLLIARALLSRPRVLLLDEPTRSLDPVSARAFRRFLREDVCERQGCTVLLATHSAEEALELCDRLAILHRGRMLAIGTSQSLADDLGDERYRLELRGSTARCLTTLVSEGVVDNVQETGRNAGGWCTVEVQLSGGAERTALLVTSLVRAGVEVARCERVSLSLAELIERIVQRKERHA